MELPRHIQISIMSRLDWQNKLRLGIKPGKLNMEKYEKLLSPVFKYRYMPIYEIDVFDETDEPMPISFCDLFIKEYHNQKYKMNDS